MSVMAKVETLQKASELKNICSVIGPMVDALGENFPKAYSMIMESFQETLLKLDKDTPNLSKAPLALIHDMSLTVISMRTSNTLSGSMPEDLKDQFMDNYVDSLHENILETLDKFMYTYWKDLLSDLSLKQAMEVNPSMLAPVVKLDMLDQYPSAQSQHDALGIEAFHNEYQELFKEFSKYIRYLYNESKNQIAELGINSKEDIESLVDDLMASGEVDVDKVVTVGGEEDTSTNIIH